MRKRCRILILGSLPPPYMGPTIATEIIIRSALNSEFDLIHLDTSDHRDLKTLNRPDVFNILLAFKHYFMLLKSTLRDWPDVIYFQICQTTLGYIRDAPFILISKLFNRKVVCHLRGANFRNWYSASSPLTRWIVRRVHPLVDGQIVLGECLRGLFRGILPDEKIFVVHNGKNVRFEDENRKDASKIRVLYLSNFIREKGILDVLKSVPEVISQYPRVEFIFIGNWFDESVKEEVEEFILCNRDLSIQIKNPVFAQDNMNILKQSDIFVFPTYYPKEGQPWVIVEAMAAGLPIITTDQGAITESVRDGVNGFIVEKRNSSQIAEKILFLIKHPEIRRKMGEESRRIYLENFTEEKMVDQLSRVFYSVLSRKN